MTGKRPAGEDNVYTVEELSQHNNYQNDFWIAKQPRPYRGDFKVYDMTNFQHPGGQYRINPLAGRNATRAFDTQHGDKRIDRSRTIKTMGIIDRDSITEDFLAGGGEMPKDAESTGNDEGGHGEKKTSEAPRKKTANRSVKRKRPVEDEEEEEAPKEKKPRKGRTAKPAAKKTAANKPVVKKPTAKKPASRTPRKAKTKNPKPVEPVPGTKAPKRPSAKKGKEAAPNPNPRPKTAAPKSKVAKLKPAPKAKLGQRSGKRDAKKKAAKPASEEPQKSVCGYWMESSNKACTRVFWPSGPTNIHCWQHNKFEP